MTSFVRILSALTFSMLLFVAPLSAQVASVSGTVTDADDGQPLAGATVALRALGSTALAGGSATDIDGNYVVSNISPGSYSLTVSFVGYGESVQDVVLQGGDQRVINVTLSQSGLQLTTVVVSASRQQEKVLDAPAAISVLSAEEIEGDMTNSAAGTLRNTTGVDMAQTGVDRYEVVLRGFNNAFSGAAFVLTDYRLTSAPSLGVNIFAIMPSMPIDLDRVEVVRGPGSALYGAGVDAGVVHFITKSPFSHQGATISVAGGERSMLSIQGRAAGVIGENIGVKVTGKYGQADDWELEEDLRIDDEVPRNPEFTKLNLNGSAEYRVNESTSIVAAAGYSALKQTVLSGIGTLQADGFGYTYGQLRLQSGNFFAQAYLNRNDAGDSFVYDTGQTVVDNSTEYNVQAQYDLSLAEGRENIIIGADFQVTTPDTEGSITGRNEEDDQTTEYGGYVQSKTAVSEQLDIVGALRADYNTVNEKLRWSPRAALVFKPDNNNTVRATFNRSFSSPGTNSNFLDIVAGQIPGTDIVIRGRGASQGFTWQRDATFGAIAPTDLVASSLIPGFEGQPTPQAASLESFYGLVYGGLAATPLPVLVGALRQAGVPLSSDDAVAQAQVGGLVSLLDPSLTQVQGFSAGALAILNPSDGSFNPVGNLTDIDPLRQTTTTTYELGYKGIVSDRVVVAVDAYYENKKNFVGPLLVETPFVFVPTLSADLTAALAAGITNNATLSGTLAALGVPDAQAAALIVSLASGSLPDATTPIAIVQPAENNAGAGQLPEVLLSYRNFGDVSYWGIDAGFQAIATDDLTVFGNVSIVSDDFFDNEELNEENVDLAVALNAPTLKIKAGGQYKMPQGFFASLSGRYIQGFPVRSGPFVGDVEDYFVLDVGAGYDFSKQAPGLRFDIGVSNVLNNEHRQFVGAPLIGRLATGRLTYTFDSLGN